MNGCRTCGGFAGRHDPIAHDAEPQEDTVPEPTDELREALERTIHAGIVSQWHGTMREDVALTDPRPIVRDLLPVVTAWAEQREAAGYERGRRDFQFAPEGDNHHNAALCPYCSPDAEQHARERAAEELLWAATKVECRTDLEMLKQQAAAMADGPTDPGRC